MCVLCEILCSLVSLGRKAERNRRETERVRGVASGSWDVKTLTYLLLLSTLNLKNEEVEG